MGVDDDQTQQPKRRSSLSEVMALTCGPLYDEIQRAFGLKILYTEILAFAKLQGCKDKLIPLAEHIGYILVNIYRYKSADIAGLTIQTRIKLNRLVQLDDECVDFDDSLLVEPEIDPVMHRLALDFLNR